MYYTHSSHSLRLSEYLWVSVANVCVCVCLRFASLCLFIICKLMSFNITLNMAVHITFIQAFYRKREEWRNQTNMMLFQWYIYSIETNAQTKRDNSILFFFRGKCCVLRFFLSSISREFKFKIKLKFIKKKKKRTK